MQPEHWFVSKLPNSNVLLLNQIFKTDQGEWDIFKSPLQSEADEGWKEKVVQDHRNNTLPLRWPLHPGLAPGSGIAWRRGEGVWPALLLPEWKETLVHPTAQRAELLPCREIKALHTETISPTCSAWVPTKSTNKSRSRMQPIQSTDPSLMKIFVISEA